MTDKVGRPLLPNLKIENVRDSQDTGVIDLDVIESDEDAWWFLDYGKDGHNLNRRWVILHRQTATGRDWWGVRSIFWDTNETAIENITTEMLLAKKAIKLIKKQLKQLDKEVN